MQESTIKGMELNGSDGDNRKSSIRRILVEGYDTALPRADVDEALREHFASCGNIIHVHVPMDYETDILSSVSFIYVNGELGQEEALRLNGSEMGGQILQIKAYPFHENYLDNELAPMKVADKYRQRT